MIYDPNHTFNMFLRWLILIEITLLLVAGANFLEERRQHELAEKNRIMTVETDKKAEKIVAEAKIKTVPLEGTKSLDDLTFTTGGYNQLLEWEKEIVLSASELEKFAGFDVLMPCCAFEKTLVPYDKNCQCGHHLASYGLIKKMIKTGFSRPEIQKETDKWINYFFPKEAVAKELERQSLTNPQVKKILEDYKSRGGC